MDSYNEARLRDKAIAVTSPYSRYGRFVVTVTHVGHKSRKFSSPFAKIRRITPGAEETATTVDIFSGTRLSRVAAVYSQQRLFRSHLSQGILQLGAARLNAMPTNHK